MQSFADEICQRTCKPEAGSFEEDNAFFIGNSLLIFYLLCNCFQCFVWCKIDERFYRSMHAENFAKVTAGGPIKQKRLQPSRRYLANVFKRLLLFNKSLNNGPVCVNHFQNVYTCRQVLQRHFDFCWCGTIKWFFKYSLTACIKDNNCTK